MGRRLGNRKGQSILEYLVITTIIVAAVMAIQAQVRTNMTSLYNNAAGKTNAAATALNGLNFQNMTNN